MQNKLIIYFQGTKMKFDGLKKKTERNNIYAFLATLVD